MEKCLSLTYEEATALLDMCLFTCLDKEGPASESALRKLGDLCREFSSHNDNKIETPESDQLACV